MKVIRLFMRDRLVAGLLVGLLAYLLVVQALIVGSAQGASAAAMADPLGVICSDIDGGIKHAAGGDPDASKCPCDALCRAAAGGAVAVLDHPRLELVRHTSSLSNALAQWHALLLARQRDPGFSARAPPVSI